MADAGVDSLLAIAKSKQSDYQKLSIAIVVALFTVLTPILYSLQTYVYSKAPSNSNSGDLYEQFQKATQEIDRIRERVHSRAVSQWRECTMDSVPTSFGLSNECGDPPSKGDDVVFQNSANSGEKDVLERLLEKKAEIEKIRSELRNVTGVSLLGINIAFPNFIAPVVVSSLLVLLAAFGSQLRSILDRVDLLRASNESREERGTTDHAKYLEFRILTAARGGFLVRPSQFTLMVMFLNLCSALTVAYIGSLMYSPIYRVKEALRLEQNDFGHVFGLVLSLIVFASVVFFLVNALMIFLWSFGLSFASKDFFTERRNFAAVLGASVVGAGFLGWGATSFSESLWGLKGSARVFARKRYAFSLRRSGMPSSAGELSAGLRKLSHSLGYVYVSDDRFLVGESIEALEVAASPNGFDVLFSNRGPVNSRMDEVTVARVRRIGPVKRSTHNRAIEEMALDNFQRGDIEHAIALLDAVIQSEVARLSVKALGFRAQSYIPSTLRLIDLRALITYRHLNDESLSKFKSNLLEGAIDQPIASSLAVKLLRDRANSWNHDSKWGQKNEAAQKRSWICPRGSDNSVARIVEL